MGDLDATNGSMIDLSRYIRPGTGVWWGQAAAEPTPLVHALLDSVGEIGPVKAFVGLTWDKRLTRDLPPELTICSYGALGDLRLLSETGRLVVIPCNYSALPRMFAERRLPSDIGFVQVSAPDSNGLCSLGVGVDYAADAIAHTPILIAEVNRRMPATMGSARIPLDRFNATIETDRALAEAPTPKATEADRLIARNVAALVDNGDTLQMGIGALPAAVMDYLVDHQNLGFHSGMVSDGVFRLIDAGVITGSHKEVDRGVAVAGSAVGSAELYGRIPDLPIEFRPASYTHSPEILSQLKSFVSINSAIEVDLRGQVGAELRHGVYVGAVGGQGDFSRAASVTGARSIIALRSTVAGESAIKSTLEGVVTTPRSDVDFVVTEHGTADLRGCDSEQSADRLINVADPSHRDNLVRLRRRD